MGDQLEKTHILPYLKTTWLGHRYHYYPEIGSTNSELRRRSQDEALPNGTVFISDYQATGKGRLARRWVAPPKSSLLMSTLFYPKWPADQSQWLTMIGCLAVIEAVELVADLTVKIKWPNDLMLEIDSVWHKFVGILVEGEMEEGVLKTAVLGIGINVNITAGQLPEAHTPATSLMLAHGKKLDRATLLIQLLTQLESWYEKINSGVVPLDAWRKKLITLGQAVEVGQLSDQTILRGTAVDVDNYGRLKVQDELGKIHLVQAGDVTLRGHFDN